ncbi:glycogen synthase [Bacteroidia bacterium]|nr:glycogen synthase [Bacteroidia bacterium]
MPESMQKEGYETRLFMPCFGTINTRRHQLHEVIRLSGTTFMINDGYYPLSLKVTSIPSIRMQIYFIDNEDYFKRKFQTHDANGALWGDNHERMVFFTRGTLETSKRLCWQPNLVHCHGWFSMLTPLFVKKAYHRDAMFSNAKVVLSVYDQGFEGALNANFSQIASLDGVSPKDVALLKEPTYVNLIKFAIAHADGVIIGSPKIHPELVKHLKDLKALKFPVLPYQEPHQQVKAYATFYNKILNI